MPNPARHNVILYGTNWCPDCIRAKLVLRRLGVNYTFINTDQDPEAEQLVIRYNQGKRIVPTIFFPDDSVLVEPSNQELTARVIALGLVEQN